MHDLDGKTGASLKLSILNPKGRIWTMVAGGGASVIYAGSSQNCYPGSDCCAWSAPDTAVRHQAAMRARHLTEHHQDCTQHGTARMRL